MTPTRVLSDLEFEIDTLLKNRAIMFDWLDKEPRNTQMYNSINGKIAKNTKDLHKLRIKWREIRETYIRR